MSNLEVQTLSFEIEGEGETQEKAIQNSFQSLMRLAQATVQMPIINMQVSDIVIQDVTSTERIEKFLYFFLPRKRVTYCVKLKVEVEIKAIKMKVEV